MKTTTWYNPLTNHVCNGFSTRGEGYIPLGDRKIAEAFTSVTPEERKLLYISYTKGKTYSFDFSMLNSKIRHKLKRLGLIQFENRPFYNDGKELLHKINNKH